MIEALQALSGGIYFVTITVVGVRLLVLARRTRKGPELWMGASLLLGGTLGASLEAGGMAAAESLPAATVGALLLAGKVCGVGALALEGHFVRRVFRNEERLGRVLLAAGVAAALVALAGFAWSGTFATGKVHLGWFALELAARLSFSIWLAAEAARYYVLMRRRLRLGIADPLVTDRFRLWAGAGVAATILLATSAPPLVLDPVRYHPLLIADLFLFSLSGVAASLLYALAFFPPAAYRRHIARAAGALAAG